MAAKIVVITGANSGIGRAAAEILASKRYDIITICRKKTEGESTAAALRAINSTIKVENFTLDLSDLDAVRKTASAIQEKYPVIDRLINNAGYYPPSIEYINGLEKSFVASHLGHMLLTEMLLPSLKKSPEARVINVSSALHMNGRASRFFANHGHDPGGAYGDAKLANVLFSMALAKELPSNVTTYSLHPGVVNTNFATNVKGAFKVVLTLISPFFITPSKGAATTVFLADALIEELKGQNGKYFAKKKPTATSNKDVTEENALALWSRSRDLLQPLLQ